MNASKYLVPTVKPSRQPRKVFGDSFKSLGSDFIFMIRPHSLQKAEEPLKFLVPVVKSPDHPEWWSRAHFEIGEQVDL